LPDQNPSGLGTFVFNLRFPGQYYDQETGLFYNYFRDYDPAKGRYIESDPIGLAGGINTYAYVINNPVNLIDPLGLSGQTKGIRWPSSPFFPNPAEVRERASKMQKAWGQFCENIKGMFNESADEESEEGCIYCVNGKNTSSGKDYVGSTDNMDQRKKDKSDGRDRNGADVVDTYPKGDRDARRTREQQAINDRGGVDNLDNKRNEVAPNKWPTKGIIPPL
jgi:RHS repeat-associated protein